MSVRAKFDLIAPYRHQVRQNEKGDRQSSVGANNED